MNKNYLSPELQYAVMEAENLVLCASVAASVGDFEKDDLTTFEDFWN